MLFLVWLGFSQNDQNPTQESRSCCSCFQRLAESRSYLLERQKCPFLGLCIIRCSFKAAGADPPSGPGRCHRILSPSLTSGQQASASRDRMLLQELSLAPSSLQDGPPVHVPSPILPCLTATWLFTFLCGTEGVPASPPGAHGDPPPR